MKDDYVLVVVAVLLAAVAVFLTAGVTVNPESVVLPDADLFFSAVHVFPAVSLVLLAGLLIKWSSRQRARRLAYWCIMVVAVSVLAPVLGLDFIVFSFLLATAVGTVLPVWTEDPCKQGVWYSVSSPRTLAFLLVLAMLSVYGSRHSQALQSRVMEKIVEVALVGAGDSGTLLDVNQLIPPGITPEERDVLIRNLRQSVPNWDQLSEEQRRQLIDNSVQQYLAMKDALRKALERGTANVDRERLREALKQQVTGMPIVRAVLENVQYLFAFIGAMWYSLITLFAEVVAFLLGVVLKLLTGSGKRVTQG